ncbi:MAG TPA: ABC transporter permease [Solirubrobacteraceae bacterium]|nr:ABC transporter permease [Solirubrobacteraceae bacterium]
MGRYIIRRLLWVIVLLIVVSAVTFLIFYELPSANPAVLRAGRSPNPALIAAISKSLGLDRPIYVQYWLYIKGIVLHFNFGYSYQFSLPVRTMIFQRLPATISLTVGAVVIWLLIGIPIGIISAVRSRSVMDRTAMGGALLAISAPSYWLGLVALYLFANDIGIVKIFDGAGTYTGLTADPGRWFGSLLLPWIVLAAAFAAFYSRLLRSNLIETMSEDYIRTARAKGLSERRVIWHHGVRAAITPIITVLGLDIGTLLGGAVLIETVFNIPGVGRLAYMGIENADLPVIQGTVLFGAFFIVIANLVVDIVYAFLDPRVRYA